MRFLALATPDLIGEERELGIWIQADEKAGTISIRDNGIGMTREEAVAPPGHHRQVRHGRVLRQAHRGRAEGFGPHRPVRRGILFGLHRGGPGGSAQPQAGEPTSAGVRWESSADGEFTVETVEHAARGTTVTLHLKEDAKEFADTWRLRSLVRRYSDHLAFPVYMPKQGEATLEFEAVNQAKAMWTRGAQRDQR